MHLHLHLTCVITGRGTGGLCCLRAGCCRWQCFCHWSLMMYPAFVPQGWATLLSWCLFCCSALVLQADSFKEYSLLSNQNHLYFLENKKVDTSQGCVCVLFACLFNYGFAKIFLIENAQFFLIFRCFQGIFFSSLCFWWLSFSMWNYSHYLQCFCLLCFILLMFFPSVTLDPFLFKIVHNYCEH